MKRHAGYSLIELMVSAAILGIVMMALVQTFTTTQKTHVNVEQITVAQQNLRLVADLIERDVRVAGYLVPRHAAVCGADSLTAADTLYLSDSDVLQSVADLIGSNPAAVGGNLGARIQGVAPGGSIGGTGATVSIADRWLDITNVDDFAVGRGVIVVDRNDANGRVACGTIMSFTPGAGSSASMRVNFVTPPLVLAPGLPPNAVAIPAHVYSINAPVPALGTPFQLVRDGALVANDVEDLQVGLFFDYNDDGVLDSGEYMGDDGSSVGDGVPLQYSAGANDGNMLRQLRISLVTATERDDTNVTTSMGRQQAVGNRDPNSLPAADRKKRRVYSSTVRLRNV